MPTDKKKKSKGAKAHYEYSNDSLKTMMRIVMDHPETHWVIPNGASYDEHGDKACTYNWRIPKKAKEVEARLVNRRTVGFMPHSLGCVVIDIDNDIEESERFVRDFFGHHVCIIDSGKARHAYVKCTEETADELGNKAMASEGIASGRIPRIEGICDLLASD